MLGHNISECPKKFCHKCGKLTEKDNHICFVRPKINSFNHVIQEPSLNTRCSSYVTDWSDQELDQIPILDEISPRQKSSIINVSSVTTPSNPYASKLSTPTAKATNTRDNNILKCNMEILTMGRGKKLRTPPTPQSPKIHKMNKNDISLSPIKNLNEISPLPEKISPIAESPRHKKDESKCEISFSGTELFPTTTSIDAEVSSGEISPIKTKENDKSTSTLKTSTPLSQKELNKEEKVDIAVTEKKPPDDEYMDFVNIDESFAN